MRKFLLFLLVSFSCAQANIATSMLTDISNAAQETVTSFKENTANLVAYLSWKAQYQWKNHPLLMTGGAITGALAGAHMLLKDGLYYTFCSTESIYHESGAWLTKTHQEFDGLFEIVNCNKFDSNTKAEFLEALRSAYPDYAYPLMAYHNYIYWRKRVLEKYKVMLTGRADKADNYFNYSLLLSRISILKSLDILLSNLDKLITSLPEYAQEKLSKNQADKLDDIRWEMVFSNCSK